MKFFKSLQHIFGGIVRHKYLWTIILFLLIVGFLDSSSFWQNYQLKKENKATEAVVKSYEERYQRDYTKLKELQSDPQARVRVARENHQMHSPDEDVYYIVDATDKEENQ